MRATELLIADAMPRVRVVDRAEDGGGEGCDGERQAEAEDDQRREHRRP